MDWTAHMRRIIERLGEDVTVTPAGGDATQVRAIYVAPYAKVLEIVATSRPAIGYMDADAATLAMGDAVTVRSAAYRVAEPPKRDPVSGVTVCDLEAV